MHPKSKPLPQPIRQFRPANLCEVVDSLLAEGVHAAQIGCVLGRSPADPLDDDGRVRLEDDAVVDDLVDGERY